MRRLFPVLLALLLLTLAHAGAEGLILKTRGQYFSFADNGFSITVTADTQADITIESLGSVYLQVTGVQLQAGENLWQWDGLGYYGEPMPRAQYDLRVCLADGSQETLTFSMGKPKQALYYALPTDDTLYLDDRSSWGMQLETSSPTRVLMTLSTEADPDTIVTTAAFESKRGCTRVNWNGRTGTGKRLAPGRYVARVYCQSAPQYVHSFTLTIAEGKRPTQQVAVTGPIMPSRSATDEEIWQLMTDPAVVFSTGEGAGNHIYEKPSAGSKVLGNVHGKSCALEVLELSEDGKWARVGAWALVRASYVEGWVLTRDLTVVTPAQDYGILIDKQEQTLTLFDHGKRAGTIRVSTGKPISKATLKRETEAGSYLTVTRTGSFATDGFHYDYPIRYNGANLLHTLGWEPTGARRDYTT